MRAVQLLPLLLLATPSSCGSREEGRGQPGGASEAGLEGASGSGGSGGNGATGGQAGSPPGGSAGTGGVDAAGDGAPPDAASDSADQDGGHVPDAFPDAPYTGKYAGIEALSGVELAKKLCELVSQGYKSMSYTAARQVVFWKSDNHSGEVLGVYDGFWHDPTHSEVNIEHTWPQSKGANTVPAQSDIHHLFPTQANFNSARGNLPFGEVELRDWPATLQGDPACLDAMPGNTDGCYSFKGKDAFGVEVFEPRDGHKGDAARAVFYFSIRYGSGCAVKPLSIFDPQHPIESEAVLKKWNLHDPPSDHERQRNDVIEAEEGVRNPFIDHPELVDRIAFQ